MDGARVDELARSLARTGGSRRTVVGLMVGGAVGLARLRFGPVGAGVQAAATCRTLRARCRKGGQCCSGRCKKRICSAGPGTCARGVDFCADGSSASLCNGPAHCACYQTMGGQTRCGDATPLGVCDACQSDGDCAARYPQIGTEVFCARANGAHCRCNTGLCIRACTA
jgi:hypothetical protein